MASMHICILVAVCIAFGAHAFQMQRPSAISRVVNANLEKRSFADRKAFHLFDEPPRLTRDSEEEFFESEFDRKPLKERLPAAFAFLGAVSLPFIVGLVYLYTSK